MIKQMDGGISVREFKTLKRIMLTTGQFDPNKWNELNEKQKYWINETKKTLRDLSMS